MESLGDFSKIKPESNDENQVAKSEKTKSPGDSHSDKNLEEKEVSMPKVGASVKEEVQLGEAISVAKNKKVEMDIEVKSQVTKITASTSAKDVQPQSIKPVASKKEPTLDSKPTSAQTNQGSTIVNLDSNSAKYVQQVPPEPMESKGESITVPTNESKGSSLTMTNGDHNQEIPDVVADEEKNQRDIFEAREHKDIAQVTAQSSKRDELHGGKTIEESKALESNQESTTANRDPNSEQNVQPLESKEELKTMQTRDEVPDKESCTMKNSSRILVMPNIDTDEKEDQCDFVETQSTENNVQLAAQSFSVDAAHEIRSSVWGSIRDSVWGSRIEIHDSVKITSEEVENLEGDKADRLDKIREPVEYQKKESDKSIATERHSEFEQENDNYPSPRSPRSEVEPRNTQELRLLKNRSSIYSGTLVQQGGMISRMRPVVAIVASIAIASAILGVYSFLQQRD